MMKDQNGLELNHDFYKDIVAGILETHFPGLQYSAALIGWGSEVIGFDDDLSADHNWGLRFQIFLSKDDHKDLGIKINEILNTYLPETYKNYPTKFEISVNPDQRDPHLAGLSRHNIDIETLESFFTRYLGWDPGRAISSNDWLGFSEHKLLAVTRGKVFHDPKGKLENVREKLNYYPEHVWIYLLAKQWKLIFDEQAFVGRCGYSGDEIGSRIIAARQIEKLMRLCFLIERRYAPYSKWFGKAFSKLNCADELMPLFENILDAKNYKTREKHLAVAYKIVIGRFNSLGITERMDDEISEYFGRPFLVIKDEAVVEYLRNSIQDEEIRTTQF
ncbi:MAG: DUF4037 domain-containing protein [Pyrinomonadaceae bacterium]